MLPMHFCFQYSQYAVSTKRNTITRFDKHMTTKEQQILKAETKLQEDAVAFEEFLRENDQRSVDALKMCVFSCQPHCFLPPSSFFVGTQLNAKLTNLLLFSAAQETINKLQMTAELKKANMEVQAVKR